MAKIALSKNAFARKAGNDVVFSNPKSGACLVLQDGGALYDAISRTPVQTTEVISKIARYCNITERDAAIDFREFIDAMIEDGLLKSFPDGEDDQCALASAKPRNVEGESCQSVGSVEYGGGDPLGEFYRTRHMPLALHMDITASCSERCVHCYLPEYPNQHLDLKTIEKVLFDFRDMNGFMVYISGGECMLHPDFERILRLCRRCDFNIAILSNLTMCDGEMVKLLQDISPQYINVSLYSMDPEEHDRITTVSGSWKKTMDAILACEKAGISIRLAAPLLKYNQGAFQGLQNFADSHNMHLIPDFKIIAKCNHDNSNLKYACSCAELEAALVKNKEIFDMGWSKASMEGPEATLCDIGVFRIHINSKGDFYPCPSMYGYVLGNAHDMSIKEVWTCKKLDYLRSIRVRDLGKCANCSLRRFCEPCVAYNFNSSGNLLDAIPEKCEMAKIVSKVYGA